MHINSISCGQGAPSMFLIHLAGQGIIKAEVVIVADTGDENDMLWSNGRRTTAGTFFSEVTKPLANGFGLDAVFVRSNDKYGKPIPDISEDQFIQADGKVCIDMPLFGSNDGRLKQSCTDKWKKQAIRQELRQRRGAKSANISLGLTMDEVHRVKQSKLKWETLAWPLIFTERGFGKRGWYRSEINKFFKDNDYLYLVRTQCDKCPHKNLFRWQMNSPDTLQEAAEWERRVGQGEYFLTDLRIPLMEALDVMKSRQSLSMFDDSCDSGYCFT